MSNVMGEPPGRRSGRKRDSLTRLDERARQAGDRFLLLELAVRLGFETRLVCARRLPPRRSAVNLLDEARPRERVEVAPDGHLGDAELLGQLAHAHGAAAANLLDDHELSLSGEHRGTSDVGG